MRFLFSLFTFLGLFFSTLANAQLLNISPDSVEASAFSIIDTQSGQTIAEYNSHAQHAPASLTKMMVAYIALKEIKAGRLHKSDILTATPVVKMVKWDESQMYLKEGQQISVDQLLAGLIVMSANDAAVTLAEHISGNVPAFLQRMNREAQALGMKDTHFSNPAGVTMPDHYSTAHDLSLLARALVTQTPDYLTYSQLPNFRFNQQFHHATNLVLKDDPSVDGLKTGYTHAAGYNMALTAHRPTMNTDLPERRLIVVVLGTKSAAKRAEIAHRLLNLAYTYTRDEEVIRANQLLAELPVVKSTLSMFKVETQKPTFVTTSLYNLPQSIDLNQFNMQTQRLQYKNENGVTQTIEPLQTTQTHVSVKLNEKQLTAPLMQAMNLATIQVYQNNHLIHSIALDHMVHIPEANIFERFFAWFKNIFSIFGHSNATAKLYPIQ